MTNEKYVEIILSILATFIVLIVGIIFVLFAVNVIMRF